MPRKLTTRTARAMARKRTRYGAGSGRPRKTGLHCPCGRYTLATAARRYHVCATRVPGAAACEHAMQRYGAA